MLEGWEAVSGGGVDGFGAQEGEGKGEVWFRKLKLPQNVLEKAKFASKSA